MTLILGKTHINLGIETLIGLLVFTISTTYAISVYLNKQDNKLDKIISWQNAHSTKDSIQDIKLDSIFNWHTKGVAERNSLKHDVDYLLSSIGVSHSSQGYYIEKKVNGHIIFEKIKIN